MSPAGIRITAREYLGTPAKFRTTVGERRCRTTPSYHARPRTPFGDSPYARAKLAQLVFKLSTDDIAKIEKFGDNVNRLHPSSLNFIKMGIWHLRDALVIQLVEKNPNKALALFWQAINSGDRVDSALKDMAAVMLQVNRAEEAIEAIKSFRNRCPIEAQDQLDNILLEIYKKCGRRDDEIELLKLKLKMIDKGVAFGGKPTKLARCRGKRIVVTIDKEKSRLLGNLAWAYMQCENYDEAEFYYREALKIEPDFNKQCNLAICTMQTGKVKEAQELLEGIRDPLLRCSSETFIKSFYRASEMLAAFKIVSPHDGNCEASEMKARYTLSRNSSDLCQRPSEACSTDNHLREPVLLMHGNKCRNQAFDQLVSPSGFCNRRSNLYGEASSLCSSRNALSVPRYHTDRYHWFEAENQNPSSRRGNTQVNNERRESGDGKLNFPGLPISSRAKASRKLIFETCNKEDQHLFVEDVSCDEALNPLNTNTLIINGEKWVRADHVGEKSAKEHGSETKILKQLIQPFASDENTVTKVKATPRKRCENKSVSPDISGSCNKPSQESSVLYTKGRQLENAPGKSVHPTNCMVEKEQTECRSKMDIFRDKVTFGSWKGVQAQVTNSSTSTSPKSQIKTTFRSSSDSIRALAGTVDEAAAIPVQTTMRSKYVSEENFQTPCVSKTICSNLADAHLRTQPLMRTVRKTWADAIKESENNTIENAKHIAESAKAEVSSVDLSEESLRTQPVRKSGRRSWAEIVEGETPS